MLIASLFVAVGCGAPERPTVTEGTDVQGGSVPATETRVAVLQKGSCSDEGHIQECKVILPDDDPDIVNCFVGEQICTGGEWSACDDPDVVRRPTK